MLLPHVKMEPAELVWASDYEAFTTSPFGGLPGMAHWERYIQNMEGLHIPSGLESVLDPSGGTGKCCCGEGRMEYPA